MATYDLTSSIPAASSLAAGDILNCPYSGAKKEITLPKGKYKLEVWGAQGGYRSSSTYGGKGGYSYGTINLSAPTTVYLYAGGFPGNTNSSAGTTKTRAGGFNGGGSRYGYYGGGGGSDIRIGQDSLYARVIVAGGGGSDGATNKKGMYGGGASGGTSTEYCGTGGGGGTQTAGGTGGSSNSGSFGQGGQGKYRSSGYAGAGGGGWYGGGGSYPDGSADDDRGGGGGSGYILTSSSSKPSGYLLGSEYYLTDAAMVAGNASFKDYSGSTVTGHSGHGACRITAIEVIQPTEENGSKNLYIKTDAKGSLPSSYTQLPYIEKIGTQYIDTNFKPNNNTRVIIDLEILQKLSAQQSIFGGRDSYQSNMFSLFTKANNAGFQNDYGTVDEQSATSSFNAIGRLYIDKNKNVININNEVQYVHTEQTFTAGYNLYLGSCGSSSGSMASSYPSYLRIYSCKIYDNGTLIRDYIPALRNSDNKAGLYDLKNSTFYTDATGGNFIYNYNTFIDSDTIYYIKGNSATTNLGNSGTITNSNVVATPNDLLYFNGTNSELKLSTGMTQGTYDFTIDWWECQTANVNNCAVYGNESRYGCLVGYTYNDKVWSYLSSNNSSWDITGGSGVEMGTVQLNKWVHRACARKGNIIYYFENGKLKNTVTSSASIIYPGTPVIGAYRDSAPHYWQGYLKHFRMSDCARWTSDFTPPSLTMGYGSNYSKVDKALIKVGSDPIDFNTTYRMIPYIESNNSQYINTGLTIAGLNCSKNFSIHIDHSQPKTTSNNWIWTMGTQTASTPGDQLQFGHRSSMFQYHFSNVNFFGDVPIVNNKRINVVTTIDFVNNSLYMGKDVIYGPGTSTYVSSGPYRNSTLYICQGYSRTYGCRIYADNILIRDYIPVVRKSDGKTGLYDKVNGVFYTDAAGGNFIYNTQDIDDNTIYYIKGNNPTENLGKSGTITNNGIIALSNDVLSLNGSSYASLSNSIIAGANDWTIDWWEYPLVYKAGSGVYHVANNTSIYYGCLIGYRANGDDVQAYASSNGSSWDILNAMQMGKEKLLAWTHRALVRKGSTFYAFENGKLISTVSSSSSIKAETPPLLGAYYAAANGFNGYLKHCRISNCARWTNDFTPPTRSYGEPWREIKSIYVKNNTPSGYTRLEYLKSNGNQYIDINLIPNQSTKTVIDCILPTTSSGSYYICGARESSYVDNYALQTTSGMYYSKHGTADVSLSIPSIDHRMKFIKDGYIFTVDGNIGYNAQVDYTCKRSMYIFACNSAGTVYGPTPCTIYNVQVYQDGTNLSRDLVPMLRNSDSKTGLYDLKNNVFYPNLGSTEFNYIIGSGWEKIF